VILAKDWDPKKILRFQESGKRNYFIAEKRGRVLPESHYIASACEI
jgi:hypothetical protein